MSDPTDYDEIARQLEPYQRALSGSGRAELSARVSDICDSVEAWAVANPNRAERTVKAVSEIGSTWRTRALYLSVLILLVAFVTKTDITQWVANTKQSPATEYATRRAQTATLQLPDGSRVVVAPETKIRYYESSTGARNIELQGQAYFTVSQSAERPFVVRTARVITRVLGTSFAVRAYPTDRVAQVAVAEGKVAIGEKEPSTVLTIGDVGKVEAGKAPVVTRDATITEVFGWMRGQFSFNDVALKDVAIELERVYDLNITFAGSSLGARPVTISFNGKSAATMLKILSLALDVRYERNGNNVVFYDK